MAANMRILRGIGTVPVVLLPGGTRVNFDPTILGNAPQTASVVVANQGTAPLIVDTARTNITGPFTITATTCDQGPIDISTGNTNYTCSYSFTFNPTTVGATSGALTLYTNDPVTPSVVISISGSALASYPVPTVTRLNIPTMSLDNGPVDRSIIGTNFFPATTVLINGVSVPVKSQNNTSITVTVDPSILGAMGEYTVQVVNPAPGGSSNMIKLTTYRMLTLTAADIIYEPTSKRLYASIPAGSTSNPNTILPIDPVTGAYGTPIPVGNDPSLLALSDDSRYLYVSFSSAYGVPGQLQRIDLKTNSVDRTFALPGSSLGVIDMHVVPGSPQLLVASLSSGGVALFNDAGVVQYIANDYANHYYTLDNFTFASGSTYYGYPVGSNSFLNSASVSDSGIVPISRGGPSCCDGASIVVSDGTLLYTNSGQVWDPQTQKLLGRYDSSLFYAPGIVADAIAKRTFILRTDYRTDSGGSGYPTVVSYDPTTITLADAIYFDLQPSPRNLARWGTDGLAFLANAISSTGTSQPQLVIFRSSMVVPQTQNIATVSSVSPTSIPSRSAALTLTVNGSGFGAGSTVLWNGAARSTVFVSASQLTAMIPATDLEAPGVAQVSVSNSGAISPSLPFVIEGPAVSLSTKTLTFPAQVVAMASAAQSVTVTNSGTTSLTGLGIGIVGTDPSSFVANSTCSGQLAPGSSCSVSVVFNAATPGGKQAMLQITDNAADNPQMVALNGTAGVLAFTISSQSLSFGKVPSGSSAQQTLTLQNSGSIALTNIATAVSGQNADDFIATTTCGASVAVNATCNITIAFNARGVADENATVTVSSAGAPSQKVTVTGTSAAPDFVFPAPTGSSTATIPAGQPANFNLNVSPYGAFTGTITMSCTSLPANAACVFTPASFALGATSTPVSLTITTQQTVRAALQPQHETSGWPSHRSTLAILLLLPAACRRPRRQLGKLQLVLLLLMFTGFILLNGCAGSSTGSSAPVETIQKTPAGTYSVSVVASSGAVSHSTNVTLVVQ
jgi:hypothetical protein